MSMKKSSDNRDLPTCKAVPQPTAYHLLQESFLEIVVAPARFATLHFFMIHYNITVQSRLIFLPCNALLKTLSIVN